MLSVRRHAARGRALGRLWRAVRTDGVQPYVTQHEIGTLIGKGVHTAGVLRSAHQPCPTTSSFQPTGISARCQHSRLTARARAR